MAISPVMLDPAFGIYSLLADGPLLAGMPYPGDARVWRRLESLGFHAVVCLIADSPPYNASPLQLLQAVLLQDLFGGTAPGDPDREDRAIRATVKRIVQARADGLGVVVHCQGGTGRTGTVLAGVLRELGANAAVALSAMQDVNAVRGREASGWPESTWQKELVVRWK